MRFIFNKYRMTDSPSLLMKQHNMPSLESRRKVSRLTFLQKCLTGNTKVTMPHCVRPHSTRKTRHTHSRALAPIFAKTKSHKYSFIPRTVSEWNALPSTVVDANDCTRTGKFVFCVVIVIDVSLAFPSSHCTYFCFLAVIAMFFIIL